MLDSAFNASSAGRPARSAFLRRSELVLLIYFAYASVVALWLPLPSAVARFTVAVNVFVIASYLLLGYAARARPSASFGMARDWLPIPLVLLAYREMGWFAPSSHTYELEQGWVLWDRLLLNDWGLREAIESLGPLLPSVLEISYALVYTIGPFSVAMLYAYGRRGRVDHFLFTFVLGTVLSYALFPYFPSEPPRTVFPGDNFPAIDTVFRRFNWWLLGDHGIHTSVFPSAHVSSAFAAAFAMLRGLPERKWVGWFLFGLAVSIFVATIYGRYHYAVDGVAGIAVSLVALALTVLIERRYGSRNAV